MNRTLDHGANGPTRPAKSLLIGGLLSLALGAQGQGTFLNLDFESATVPYLTNTSRWVAPSDALPNWTPSAGDSPQTTVPYHAFPGATYVGLYANKTTPWLYLGGLFSARFMPRPDEHCSLSQVGLIPGDALSLQFTTHALANLTPLTVSFDGLVLSPALLWADTLYKTYAADVSAYAGTTGELRAFGWPITSW